MEFLKTHQQKIVILIGFLLVAAISFAIGRATAFKYSAPEIKVEQAFTSPTNYSPNVAGIQSEAVTNPTTTTTSSPLSCVGLIKGTSSLIYHVPGDAFYDRTTKPIRCFNTEEEAIAAGFRKSTK
ncbi:MAG TPA: hypothetical protein VL306_02210 [Methylomirabilota bacterium]|jgi:hypothetical protein|nr:hypothetical protein [Methylomirabilota bacterium]